MHTVIRLNAVVITIIFILLKQKGLLQVLSILGYSFSKDIRLHLPWRTDEDRREGRKQRKNIMHGQSRKEMFN